MEGVTGPWVALFWPTCINVWVWMRDRTQAAAEGRARECLQEKVCACVHFSGVAMCKYLRAGGCASKGGGTRDGEGTPTTATGSVLQVLERAETRAHFHSHRTLELSNQGSSLFVLPRVVRV